MSKKSLFFVFRLTEVTWSHHLLSSFTGALSASRALLQHHNADVPDAVPAMPGIMAGMAREPQVVLETRPNPGSPRCQDDSQGVSSIGSLG